MTRQSVSPTWRDHQIPFRLFWGRHDLDDSGNDDAEPRGEVPFPVVQDDMTLMIAEMTADPRGDVTRSISGLEIFSSEKKKGIGSQGCEFGLFCRIRSLSVLWL